MTATIAPELLQLGRMLGLVDAAGAVDFTWFEDPGARLSTIIRDSTQRGAALELLRSLLGTAEHEVDLPDAGATSWFPLVRHAESGGALYLVLEETSDHLDVLLGGRVAREQSPRLAAGFTALIPLVRVDLDTGAAEVLPRPAEMGAALTFPGGIDTGVIALHGVVIAAIMPLDDPEDARLAITLAGLRLPGQEQPADVSISELAEDLGPSGVRIGLALLQAQFATLPAELRNLLALVGLDAGSAVPPLPIDDLFTRGPVALRDWLRGVFTVEAATAAWLLSLRELLGLPAEALSGSGTAAAPFQLCFEDAGWRGCLTLVVTADPATGAVVLAPGMKATIDSTGALDGGLDASIDLCRLIIGPVPSVVALPMAGFSARIEGSGGPLIDETVSPPGIRVRIGSLVAGMGLRAGSVAPVFEARDVTLGQLPGDRYDVLDLTSAEALSNAVAGVLDDIFQRVLDALGVTTSDEGRAVAALAGLIEPQGAPATWPDLVALPDLFADPLTAIGCYHARVLDAESGPSDPTPWSLLAAEIGVLLRATGASAPEVSGAGTAADPWVVTLFREESGTSPFGGEVQARIYTEPAGEGSSLRLSLAAAPLVPQFAGKTMTLAYVMELLRAEFPAAAACPGPVDVSFAGAQSLGARLGDDLVFHTDGLQLGASSISLGVRWESARLGLFYEIADPKVAVDGTPVSLPPLRLDFDADLPDIDVASIPWDAVQALAGAWFTDSIDDWLPSVGALLGWLPSQGGITLRLPDIDGFEPRIPAEQWPPLPLDELAGADPVGAIRAWLGSLVSTAAGDFPDLSYPVVARLSRLLSPPVAPNSPLTAPAGTGTYSDPWRLPVADEGPELLLWVDPDGPSIAGLAGLADHLLPQELTDAAAGNGTLTSERIEELLGAAAALHPPLREALDGVPTGASIQSIRTRLLAGDGLVPASAQAPAGWPTAAMEPVAHLAEPAAFDPSAHLPTGAPGEERRVFVATSMPGLSEWPGQTPERTIDLTAPGLAPEAFDLSAITAPGPWFILLPARVDAQVTQPEESPTGASLAGDDALAARLKRALEVAAAKAGAPLCLIAHSTAGQVARVVAASASVSHLVTIGTPHGAADLSFVTEVGAGEGIRLLQRLVEAVPPADLPANAQPLMNALDALRGVMDGSVAEETGGPLHLFPAADASSPPEFPPLPASVNVQAVVGRLLPAELDRAVAALVRAVIEAVLGNVPGAGDGGEITHIGVGVSVPAFDETDPSTQLRIAGEARVDLAHVRLQPGGRPRPVPRVTVQTSLRRSSGWLVGGPGVGGGAPLPLDPRVRWAEATVEADLSTLDVRARVVLHDAAVFGVAHPRWIVDDVAMVAGDDGTSTLLPEARVLLGEIVARLQPIPATGPLRDVVELAAALRLAEIGPEETVTVPPDPLERLIVDPLGELRARLAPGTPDRTALVAALRSLLSATGSEDEIVVALANGLELVVVVGTEGLGDAVAPRPTALTFRTTADGFAAGNHLRFDGSIDADGAGRIAVAVSAGSTAALGPAGRPVLAVAVGGGAEPRPAQVTLAFEDAAVPAIPGPISLYPLDTASIAAWAVRALPALVLGHVLRFLGGLSDPVRRLVETLAGASGVGGLRAPPPSESEPPDAALDAAGPALRRAATRLIVGLTRDPVGWLLHPGVLGGSPVAAPGPVEPNGAALLPTLSASALERLLEELRAGLGLTPIPGAPLSLPYDLLLDIQEPRPGVVALRLGWSPGTIAAGIEADGSLTLEVHPGFEVRPSLAADLRLVPPPGFDHVELTVGLDSDGAPSLAFSLQQSGSGEVTVTVLPTVSGLDSLAALAGQAVHQLLPLLLNAAAANGTIGPAVVEIGDALALRTAGKFDAAALASLANADASDLAARLATGAVGALTPLLSGIGGLLEQVSDAVAVDAASRTVTVTPFTSGTSSISVTLTANPAAPSLCVVASSLEPVAGRLRADFELCFSTPGIERLRAWIEVIDDAWLAAGPISFLPSAGVLLGGAAGVDGNRVETGLWLGEPPPPTGERRGIFALVATSTASVSGACRTESGASPGVFVDASDTEAIASCVRDALLAWLAPLLGELVIDLPDVTELLRHQVDGRNIGNILSAAQLLDEQGSGASATYDLRPDVFDPDVIGTRLLALVGELAGFGSIPGLDPVVLELREEPAGTGRTAYGIGVSLAEPLVLYSGDGVRLSLAADADWMGDEGAPDPGVTILFFQVDDGTFANPEFAPDVTVGGLGLRAENPDGVLLDVLVTVAGVEANVSYRRDFAAGAASMLSTRLLVDDLTIPVGRAAGGSNPVASKILSQGNEEPTTQAGDNDELAPSLSPQLRFDFVPAFDFSFELAEGTLPVWIPIQRSFGPIYVEQVGADSSDGDDPRFILLLDGGVSLEGFALGVDDLSVSIPIKRPQELEDWQLGLAGLALGYDRNGIRIAGGFRHIEGQYAGMVQVEVAQYGITAVGAYGEFPVVAGSATPTYTSFFIFGALSAPLGGPPAFFVTGIGAGVGLNRRLAIPDEVRDVTDFTLVKAMDPTSGFAADPLGSLRALIGDFPVERGTFWFAAGVRFTSFALVESVAVLTVQIGDHLEINLLGLSRADLPRKELTLARVELALRARFSSRELVLSVEAQLTDNSWLLTRDCRLTGGFAFVVWFRTGEFVLTLGGYHPRFNKPAAFPVVPRLGFDWRVSDALVIKGEAYFALTSSCLMAGGKLEAGYTTSVVWATLTFGADAIFSWDPFFYEVSAYARVSGGARIRICFFACATIKLSFSIGADVTIKGPELSGRATLDLDVVSFTVRFGASQASEPPALPWGEFHDKYLLQGDPADVAMGLAFVAGLQPADPSTTTSDSPPDDGSRERPWRVLPEFVFLTNTRAASTTAELSGDGTTREAGSLPLLGVAPMKLSGVTSVHRITISADAGDIDVRRLDFGEIVGKVPDAVWSYAAGANEPTEPRMRDAIVGASVAALPEIVGRGANTILIAQTEAGDPHPLPFHDEIAARDDFNEIAEAAIDYRLNQPLATAEILNAATTKALAASSFERRVFAAELTTPPRLAALGEGMVDDVRSVPEVERIIEEVEPPVEGTPKRPVLIGVLRTGTARAIEAPLLTSVSVDVRDEVAARRVPAIEMPTIASVNAAPPGATPVRLELTGTRAVEVGRTITAAGEPPTTTVAAGRRWAVHGTGGSRATLRSLRALDDALDSGFRLVAGDVVVWQVPGSAFDEPDADDAPAARPRWSVAGTQHVRTVILDRAGEVLADRTGDQYDMNTPVGAHRVVLLGVGRVGANNGASPGGLAGWQETTALARAAPGTFIGPRCVVIADGGLRPDRRSAEARSSAALLPAGAAVAAAEMITTRLPGETTAVAVILDGVDEARCGDVLARELILRLDGAAPDGRPPVLLATENRLIAIYGARPHRAADAVAVHLARPEHWRVAGLVGGPLERDALVTQLDSSDVSSLIGPLVATSIGISKAAWSPPYGPEPDLAISPEEEAVAP